MAVHGYAGAGRVLRRIGGMHCGAGWHPAVGCRPPAEGRMQASTGGLPIRRRFTTCPTMHSPNPVKEPRKNNFTDQTVAHAGVRAPHGPAAKCEVTLA